MPRILHLFCGTGSLHKPFTENGWEVSALDIDPRNATIVCDILEFEYRKEPIPDVIWAGCPCEQFSCANTRGKRNLALADSLIARTWEIIDYFLEKNPQLLWFIENPFSSLLWRRAVSFPLHPRVTFDACSYGALWRKRTRIATNAPWTPRALCDPKVCHACVDRKHIRTAQRGPQRGCRDESCTLAELHGYPQKLCEEVYKICAQHTWEIL